MQNKMIVEPSRGIIWYQLLANIEGIAKNEAGRTRVLERSGHLKKQVYTGPAVDGRHANGIRRGCKPFLSDGGTIVCPCASNTCAAVPPYQASLKFVMSHIHP